ncbi:TadE/TadG family type IV pilus assembly protein [Kutzneria buriramensis]|uniref:TadE/TadG family type IV pilus assembly protein n=1 Tax=Kutzneria buriramensis TaxID=1045776 RepID=UPI0014771676|nr:TadE family protein [Kutzneria buriramensis]
MTPLRTWAGDDRGSVAVEVAMWLMPALLAVFGLVQLALWWAAVDTCSAAAQEGLDTGRVVGGSPTAAEHDAATYIARVAALARYPKVSTSGTTDTVMRVTVSADVVLIVPIPGWQWHVERAAVGAREHATNP